jgi:dihydrolipoamide dehydrogenase
LPNTIELKVPDIGDFTDVEVIEVLVAPGDQVQQEDPLITLESDKATMDVPSAEAGTIKELTIQVGDKISEGDTIAVLEVGRSAATQTGTEDTKPVVDAVSPAIPEAPGQGEIDFGIDRPAPTPKPSVAGAGADRHAELVVLGSGPGGYTAAFRAADLGKKTILIERYPTLGGVCLNVGCIPSKALLHTAAVIDETRGMSKHGLKFSDPKIDLDKLRDWKDSVVGKLTKGLAGLAGQRKVEVIQGWANFAGPNDMVVDTANGEITIGFDHAIIAAGSQSMKLPGFPEHPRIIDSTGALALAEIPKRMLIVGGGIIGLEMAAVYGSLGSKITVVELTSALLPGVDADLVKPLQRRISKLYKNIYLDTKVTALEPDDNGVLVTFEGKKAPESDTFDVVLVAVGRRPNGHEIGADLAGVQVDDRGFIEVDSQQRTNVGHIFAIGDIVGQPMLAHKATHEGKVAAEVCAGMKSHFDARVIPNVAYTDPEVAWVGVTEGEAKSRGLDYGKGVFPWAASGRALGLGREEGMTKLIFDNATRRVIGAGIVGPHAGDLIAEATLAIEMDCEAEDIGLTIHPHPTLSETVAFSAEAYDGTITDLYMPKRK